MARIYSWNVNGIRAAARKGFFDVLTNSDADIFCVQETKAQPDQLSEDFIIPDGYHSYWSSAERKGYSGVAVFARTEPLSVSRMEIPRFDSEGRALILEYPDFTLIGAYFPNSQEGGRRLDYKLDFCNTIHGICDELDAAGKHIVLCGDYNIAHKPIDLANPKQNEKNAGYLPEEREWMETFTGAGYLDTFRMFNSEPGHYSWWTYRANARARNIGWRIDYHCVNGAAAPRVKSADILPEIYGSDHCPVVLELDEPQ
ncbi:MAG: exodeoxyribonuclease III [Spirochaetes bacterium]|jgi:exodeoxyribonuclease-3|nr:exodeoxyribonuclease III [Spirochaetota bacterium]